MVHLRSVHAERLGQLDGGSWRGVEGGVYIFMGHAETDADNLAKPDHLITQAWARGMRIVTRAEALDYIAEHW